MKILHLTDERWDSGLTAYALQVAKLLQNHGEDIVIGVSPGKKPEQSAKELGLETAPVNSLLSLRRLLLSRDWDIINAHTGRMHTWSVILTRFSSFFSREASPAIVRTRGDARSLKTHALIRCVYRRTDAVIAASRHIGRQYERELGMKEEYLRIIYPGVKADETLTPPPADCIGILGRLDPVKGHSIFLEAASYVLRERPHTRFLIAGKEAGTPVELLKNQAVALGIENQVEFLGFQVSALDFMRSCSVGVIASLGSEEISRACLEWMSVGRPVIGTLVGSLPELIETDETGCIVPPGDSAPLAESLLKLLQNPHQIQKWGENAWNLVKKKFSPEKQLEETLSLYHEALKNRVPPNRPH